MNEGSDSLINNEQQMTEGTSALRQLASGEFSTTTTVCGHLNVCEWLCLYMWACDGLVTCKGEPCLSL